MQLIEVAPPAPGAAAAPGAHAALQALGGVIDAIGRPDFARAGLAALNGCMLAGWWSIYRLYDDAPPRLHGNASQGVPDGTEASWRVYRASLYPFDDTFARVRDQLDGDRVAMMHLHADEVPARHRDAIYRRHGILERLSVASRAPDDGGLLAVNLYRHETQRPFRDDDIDQLGALSRPLLACVQRHVAVAAAPARRDPLATLPPRERQVCERLLKGWTHDGIAADLGLAPTTVKTYRDRAFDRLGIHHRNELFALSLATDG